MATPQTACQEGDSPGTPYFMTCVCLDFQPNVTTRTSLFQPHENVSPLNTYPFPDPFSQALHHLSNVLLSCADIDLSLHRLEDDQNIISRLYNLSRLAFNLPNRRGHGRRYTYTTRCDVCRHKSGDSWHKTPTIPASSDTVGGTCAAFCAFHSRNISISLEVRPVRLNGYLARYLETSRTVLPPLQFLPPAFV